MERTTGPSYMGEILRISVEKKYRHYFYGSTEKTLEKLKQELEKNYPGIQIVGMYSPPFRLTTPEEDVAVVKRINETKPDFVWVGLGAPKQEKWMAAHPVSYTHLDVYKRQTAIIQRNPSAALPGPALIMP